MLLAQPKDASVLALVHSSWLGLFFSWFRRVNEYMFLWGKHRMGRRTASARDAAVVLALALVLALAGSIIP